MLIEEFMLYKATCKFYTMANTCNRSKFDCLVRKQFEIVAPKLLLPESGLFKGGCLTAYRLAPYLLFSVVVWWRWALLEGLYWWGNTKVFGSKELECGLTQSSLKTSRLSDALGPPHRKASKTKFISLWTDFIKNLKCFFPPKCEFFDEFDL